MNNLNVTSIVAIMIGVVLLYSAVKKKDPRDVVRNALGLPSKYQEQGWLRAINTPPTTGTDPTVPGAGGVVPKFTTLPLVPTN